MNLLAAAFILFFVILALWQLVVELEDTPPVGRVKVIEFPSTRSYSNWLAQMGEKVTIINVSTTKRWSIWLGFLGDAKTYTVTYEEKRKE